MRISDWSSDVCSSYLQIHKQQGTLEPMPTRRIQTVFQPVQEQGAIGQPGQGVIERQLLDACGLELLLADVRHHPDPLDDLARAIAHYHHRQQHGPVLTGTMPAPEFALPPILADRKSTRLNSRH